MKLVVDDMALKMRSYILVWRSVWSSFEFPQCLALFLKCKTVKFFHGISQISQRPSRSREIFNPNFSNYLFFCKRSVWVCSTKDKK